MSATKLPNHDDQKLKSKVLTQESQKKNQIEMDVMQREKRTN
jgi:hypothetical protein